MHAVTVSLDPSLRSLCCSVHVGVMQSTMTYVIIVNGLQRSASSLFVCFVRYA